MKRLDGSWIKHWDAGRAHFYPKSKKRALCGRLNAGGQYYTVSPGYDPCLRCEKITDGLIVAEGEAILKEEG